MRKIFLKSIFAICIVVSFSACEVFDDWGKKKEKTDCLTGTWENYNSEVLIFKSNKTGQLNSPDTTYNFTYKIENEKIIFIYDKETARDGRRNEINGSDTLSYSCNCPNLKIDNKEWHRQEGSPCNDENSSSGGGGGSGGGYADRFTAKMTPKYLGQGFPGSATPIGYGALMVYFEELCIKENEKVSVYIDDGLIGNISKAAGYQEPPLDEKSDRCISGLLEVGYHTISLKIGREVITGEPIKIEQDCCLVFVSSIVCKKSN